MTELKRFLGKPKTYTIGGEEIVLHPLTIKNVDILMDMNVPAKQADATKRLIITTLRKTFPTASELELEEMSMGHFSELMEAIMDVNNMPVPKETPATEAPLPPEDTSQTS